MRLCIVSEGPIHPRVMEGLTSLNAFARNIICLTDSSNLISDISPLANLANLTSSYLDLYLGSNQISDISPVANLTRLTSLDLSGNEISDISPVANLTRLSSLYFDCLVYSHRGRR